MAPLSPAVLRNGDVSESNPRQKKSFKVQSYKLYNSKYMIASTQITNTEIFAFVAGLVFKLLSRKVFFVNRKETVEK